MAPVLLVPSNALARYFSRSPARSIHPNPSTPRECNTYLPLPIRPPSHEQAPGPSIVVLPPEPPQVPSNQSVQNFQSLVRNKEMNKAKEAFRANQDYTAVFDLIKSCSDIQPDQKIMLNTLEHI